MVRHVLHALAAALALAGQALAQEKACPAGRVQVDLGLTGFDCTACEMRANGASATMVFGAEPRLNAPRPGGPADGKIKPGDALVAVDGLLITTSAGSRRLAQATVGKPIRLTVRRAGEELDVKLVPAGRCLTAVSSGKTPAASWPQASAGTEANAVHRPRLGIGLTCWPCGRRVQGATESFSFATPPEVARVQPDGPGARAGVRPGDRILEIDGVPLTTREGGQRIGALREGQPVKLTIEREKQRLVVQLVPAW